MLCRVSGLRFSLVWMCYVSMGWSSTTTSIVCTVTFLERYLPCAGLPTGPLVLEMLPSNSEKGQHPLASHALSTRHWGLHSGAQEEGTPSFESSIFQSEHEQEHTSSSKDNLLNLLNLPECSQTWTRVDKRAKTYHHVILGTFVGECCANHDR